MSGRLQDKIAVIVGAGQSAGETIGNGRAMAVLFARNGAQVLCVDRHLESAVETAAMIAEEGGSAVPFQADVSRDADCAAVVAEARSRWGRIESWSTMSALAAAATAPPIAPTRRPGTASLRSISNPHG